MSYRNLSWNEKIVKTGVFQESFDIRPVAHALREMKSGLLQFANVSTSYVNISKYDLDTFELFGELPGGMDILFMAWDYSLLVNYKGFNITRLSNVIRPAWTFILSPAPLAKIKSSLSILDMQLQACVCFFLSIILVSLTMTLIDTIETRSKMSGRRRNYLQSLTKFSSKLIDYLWKNVFLFFFEPYQRVSPSQPWRLVLGSWLLGVTFVGIAIGTVLKSEFTDITFDKIDTVEQLIEHANRIEIGIMDGGTEDIFVQGKMRKDDNYKRLYEILRDGRRITIEELLVGNVFEDIEERQLVLISSSLVSLALMTEQFYDKKNLYDFKQKFYFSPSIDNSYSVAILSESFAGTPMADLLNHLVTLIAECGLAHNVILPTYFMLDFLRWIEPEKESTELSFLGAKSIFLLFAFGMAFATIYVLANIIFVAFRETFYNNFRKTTRNLQSRGGMERVGMVL